MLGPPLTFVFLDSLLTLGAAVDMHARACPGVKPTPPRRARPSCFFCLASHYSLVRWSPVTFIARLLIDACCLLLLLRTRARVSRAETNDANPCALQCPLSTDWSVGLLSSLVNCSFRCFCEGMFSRVCTLAYPGIRKLFWS